MKENETALTFSDVPEGGREVIIRLVGEPWHVEVLIDREWVGSGTSPRFAGALDLSSEILFGDTNDHLNSDDGALTSYGIEPWGEDGR